MLVVHPRREAPATTHAGLRMERQQLRRRDDVRMPAEPPLSTPLSSLVRFGDFEADLRSGELRRKGRRIRIQEKPFQVLAALLERPGEVVLREELRRRLWPDDAFGDFDHNLHTAVGKLRQALCDSAAHPRYVETLPRRGYRFVAPVTGPAPLPAASAPPPAEMELPAAAAPPASGDPIVSVVPPDPAARGAAARRALRPWLRPALALLLAATVAALTWLWFDGRIAERRPPTARPARLAVLPFANPGGEARDEVWSNGLTDELITHLGRLQPARLAVIARTSAMAYEGTAKPAERIARELAADYLLEGAVRRPGERLRIEVRLIRAGDRTNLWAETFEGTAADLPALQARIAARVAISLALALLPEERRTLARAGTTDTAAYESYLHGLYEWRRQTPDGHRASLAHFRRAAALDPGYAPAYASLASVYVELALMHEMAGDLAFAQARAAARTALDLFEALPEAHTALANVLLFHERDLHGAENELRRALELNPSDPLAWESLGGLLAIRGRPRETLAAYRRALALDPLSLLLQSDYGWVLLNAGEHAAALAHCRKVLGLMPAYPPAVRCQWLALDRLGRPREALAAARRTLLLWGLPPEAVAGLGRNGTAAGLDEALRLQIGIWHRQGRDGRSVAYRLARDLADLGRHEEALRWLRRAVDERDCHALFAGAEMRFAPLRGDPRFQALLRDMGVGG